MAYPGGKNGAGVYQTIINLMPPHQVYIEPFLGGGAIMRLKRPASLNIGIDRDAAAVKKISAELATRGDSGSKFRILTGNGIGFLERHEFTGQELVYCDPPYLKSTRTSGDLYRFEMTDTQHARLLDVLKALPCAVMISGYYSDAYSQALANWNFHTFTGQTRGGPRTEWVWYNFEPAALHDYRYLGTNFRERERIKRKKSRWLSRLNSMNQFERQALLCAIGEAWNLDIPSPPAASVDVVGPIVNPSES